ncbi:MAG: hypothetical protein ACI8RA_001303 [Chlamydiales bacterium]|jgi:hypothetical protein
MEKSKRSNSPHPNNTPPPPLTGPGRKTIEGAYISEERIISENHSKGACVLLPVLQSHSKNA